MKVGKNNSIFKKVIVKKKEKPNHKTPLDSPTPALYNTYAVALLICMILQTMVKTLLRVSKVC